MTEQLYDFDLAMTDHQLTLLQRGIELALKEAGEKDDEFVSQVQMAIWCADPLECYDEPESRKQCWRVVFENEDGNEDETELDTDYNDNEDEQLEELNQLIESLAKELHIKRVIETYKSGTETVF